MSEYFLEDNQVYRVISGNIAPGIKLPEKLGKKIMRGEPLSGREERTLTKLAETQTLPKETKSNDSWLRRLFGI